MTSEKRSQLDKACRAVVGRRSHGFLSKLLQILPPCFIFIGRVCSQYSGDYCDDALPLSPSFVCSVDVKLSLPNNVLGCDSSQINCVTESIDQYIAPMPFTSSLPAMCV